jgi:hypothetical protein
MAAAPLAQYLTQWSSSFALAPCRGSVVANPSMRQSAVPGWWTGRNIRMNIVRSVRSEQRGAARRA